MQLRSRNKPFSEIGCVLNRCGISVRQRSYKLINSGEFSLEEDNIIIHMRSKHKLFNEIGFELNRSEGAVRNRYDHLIRELSMLE